MPSPRYAIYFAPPPDSPLAQFGAGVLGYDCFEGVDVPHLAIPGINPSDLPTLTAEPRRYGFHATLMAPFRLGRGDEQDVLEAAAALANSEPAVLVGRVKVICMGSFIVLRPEQERAEIDELAAACLTAFDPFRAPMSAAERERRLAAKLSPRQIALMDRWGYPYVLEEFRFHLTLAGPVPQDQRPSVTASFERAFAKLAQDHVEIGAISLLRQDRPEARFRVIERWRLTGK
jgi:putative phosphonate metabolism protein